MSEQSTRLQKLLADSAAAAARRGAESSARGEQPKKLSAFESTAGTVVAPALEAVATQLRSSGHAAEVKNFSQSPSSPSGYPDMRVLLEIRLKGSVGPSVLTFSNNGSSQVMVGAVFKNQSGSSEMRSANSFPIASLTPALVESLGVDFVEEALTKSDLL